MTAHVGIRNGAIYLSSAVVDTYFRDIDSVIALIRDGELHILPVRQMASGGYLLKHRNAAGDRVAIAPDVFQAHGLGGLTAEELEASWSRELGALVVPLSPRDCKDTLQNEK
jgi:hypothetical protein